MTPEVTFEPDPTPEHIQYLTPSAVRECRMMLIEPAGTVNTGDAQSDRTAEDGVWV